MLGRNPDVRPQRSGRRCVGSGGREAATVWQFGGSRSIQSIYRLLSIPIQLLSITIRFLSIPIQLLSITIRLSNLGKVGDGVAVWEVAQHPVCEYPPVDFGFRV